MKKLADKYEPLFKPQLNPYVNISYIDVRVFLWHKSNIQKTSSNVTSNTKTIKNKPWHKKLNKSNKNNYKK
jgi:hypothetical protein